MSGVKSKSHHDFIRGKIKIIVATIAFGMGINKSDVRVIVHYGSPKNIEGYYQEIGRAGRDGKKAHCYAFYDFRDFMVQECFISKNSTTDYLYKKTQLKLLGQMKSYMVTTKCRRKILLEYFDDQTQDKCGFCDNCCDYPKKTVITVATTQQNVQNEAKLLINLIESIANRNYGIGTYINILRGSANKNITPQMRDNKLYGTGKHRTVIWWKELSDNLVKLGYLQQNYLRGRFIMQVIKVTKQGTTWANMSDFSELLELNIPKLESINMATSI